MPGARPGGPRGPAGQRADPRGPPGHPGAADCRRTACREWNTDELYELFRRAWVYRNLSRADFDRVVQFQSEGITDRAGRTRTHLHHDHSASCLRARRGTRLLALTNGGAIGEVASYRVVAEPDHTMVGTLDEDFATETQAGVIFLLGNNSWRNSLRARRRGGCQRCARGAPHDSLLAGLKRPGRTLELSEEVSHLRERPGSAVQPGCGMISAA